MERMRTSTTAGTTGASNAHDPKCAGVGRDHSDASRALRNTYALLAVTLLFSAAVAAASLTLKLPAPGIILTLAGYFGLLFAIYKLKNSVWALPTVFGLTGLMGYGLGPMLTRTLAVFSGSQAIMLTLAATGTTFLALSAYVLKTRRDFSSIGSFCLPAW